MPLPKWRIWKDCPNYPYYILHIIRLIRLKDWLVYHRLMFSISPRIFWTPLSPLRAYFNPPLLLVWTSPRTSYRVHLNCSISLPHSLRSPVFRLSILHFPGHINPIANNSLLHLNSFNVWMTGLSKTMNIG
jgi:hypothetical protein